MHFYRLVAPWGAFKDGKNLRQVGTLIIQPGIDSALFDFEFKTTGPWCARAALALAVFTKSPVNPTFV